MAYLSKKSTNHRLTKYPSGNVTNIFLLKDDTSGEYLNNTNPHVAKVPADAMSWSAISGRHYIVTSQSPAMPYGTGLSSGRAQSTRLYVGTTDRSEGDTQDSTSTDTILFQDYQGRNLVSSTAVATEGYYTANIQGYFTAGSTAIHYVYLTIHMNSSVPARFGNSSIQPWTVIIYEVMP